MVFASEKHHSGQEIFQNETLSRYFAEVSRVSRQEKEVASDFPLLVFDAKHTKRTRNNAKSGVKYPNAGVNYSNTGQNYPNTGEKYSNAGVNYPDTGEKYPGAGVNYPNVGQNYPALEVNHPSLGQKYPGIGEILPDVT